MRKVNKNVIGINGVAVDTYEKTVDHDSCRLNISAGTTGFCGGGKNYGGRTFLRIGNAHGCDMLVRPLRGEAGKTSGVEIALCGDDELLAMIEALRFAEKTLLSQTLQEGGVVNA